MSNNKFPRILKPAGVVDHEHIEDNRKYNSAFQMLVDTDDGFILGRCEDALMRYQTDSHLLSIGPTGSGKTSGLIIPNLLDHQGSAFVIDIKGETVERTADSRRLLGQEVIVLDPYNITEGKWGRDTYNPFDLLLGSLNDPSYYGKLDRLAKALMFDPEGRTSKEPIWDNVTKNLLKGLLHLCCHYWQPINQNLSEVYDVLLKTSDEMQSFTETVEALIEHDEKAQDDKILMALRQALRDTDTKMTVNAAAQARTVLEWLNAPNFQKITERSTFSFEEMQKRPMTVYLVISDEHIESCAIWTRMILDNAVYAQKDVFQTKGVSTSQLQQKDRVLFLLDEIPAFGQLDIVSKGMATLRSRGINLWLFLQHTSQLEQIYGETAAKVIIGNAGVMQAFGSMEINELEYLVRVIGDEFIDIPTISHTVSRTTGETITNGTSWNKTYSSSETESSSLSNSYSRSSSWNWGKSSDGKIVSKNRGGSSGKTRGKTTTSGRSKTEQMGSSYGGSRTISVSNSTTISDGISVTPQRMSIETVRSLRQKIGKVNQLIVVKGAYHPILCPRMSYFIKYSDRNQYMFPYMAAIGNKKYFDDIVDRNVLIEQLVLDQSLLDQNKLFDISSNLNEEEKLDLAIQYKRFFTEDVATIRSDFEMLNNRVKRQQEDLSEVAVAALAVIDVMINLEVEEFANMDATLVEQMRSIEEEGMKKFELPDDFYDRYKNLRLVGESLKQDSPYQRTDFLISLYSQAFTKFMDDISEKKEKLLTQIELQEATRVWLKETLEKLQKKMEFAFFKAREGENQIKFEFFKKKYIELS